MYNYCQAFLEARDFLLANRTDYATAARDFRWPQLTEFNWALDYFDELACNNDARTSSTKAGPRRCTASVHWLSAPTRWPTIYAPWV